MVGADNIERTFELTVPWNNTEHGASVTTQVDHHVHDQLSHPSSSVFLSASSGGAASRIDGTMSPSLSATIPMLGAKIFSLAGQVSTRVPVGGRPQHRIWTKADERSQRFFGCGGWMEVLLTESREMWHTPPKASTTTPPMSVLLQPVSSSPRVAQALGCVN